jgi:uncharacterized protein with GYD domain
LWFQKPRITIVHRVEDFPEVDMPKYLITASYTAEGLKGLLKDGGSSRRAAVQKAAASVGGKVETIYYTFGEHDVIAICDLPDNIAATSLSLTVGASGLVRTATTPLITPEEVDAASKKSVTYSGPGA